MTSAASPDLKGQLPAPQKKKQTNWEKKITVFGEPSCNVVASLSTAFVSAWRYWVRIFHATGHDLWRNTHIPCLLPQDPDSHKQWPSCFLLGSNTPRAWYNKSKRPHVDGSQFTLRESWKSVIQNFQVGQATKKLLRVFWASWLSLFKSRVKGQAKLSVSVTQS